MVAEAGGPNMNLARRIEKFTTQAHFFDLKMRYGPTKARCELLRQYPNDEAALRFVVCSLRGAGYDVAGIEVFLAISLGVGTEDVRAQHGGLIDWAVQHINPQQQKAS